jgi:phage terminase small subunit
MQEELEYEIESIKEKLTNKQRMFCEFYARGFSRAESLRRAGYGSTYPSIMTQPNIQEYILEIKQSLNDKTIASIEDVLSFFSKVMEGTEIDPDSGLGPTIQERMVAGKEVLKHYQSQNDLQARLVEAKIKQVEQSLVKETDQERIIIVDDIELLMQKEEVSTDAESEDSLD